MTIGFSITSYSAQTRLVLVLACTLMFYLMNRPPLLVSAHSHDRHHVSLEQIQTEYLQWVARVGHKQTAKMKSSHAEGSSSTSLWGGIKDQQVEYRESEVAARVITVNKRGTGDFKSVQAAVHSIASGNQQRVIIQIESGIYEEKVKIPKTKPYITLQGAAGGGGQTVITWHDNARSAGTTFKSATVSVMSDGFIARDVTFSNTAPYPQPGSRDMQAVAFQISGDKAAFYDCRFLGTQDTLYDHKGRHYFRNCVIQGSVDFIFGGGLSLYENCELRAIAKAYGSFTAQKRKSGEEDSGFSFVRCRLTGSGLLYLGRAWGPYSRVVFVSSSIDAQIVPDGWYNWGDAARERTVFYGQYNCLGAGASMKGRVVWSHQLTAAQAAPFMSLSFVNGEQWITQ